MRNAYKMLAGKPEERRPLLLDLGDKALCVRITSNWILNKWD
jgi:hypothetical protein